MCLIIEPEQWSVQDYKYNDKQYKTDRNDNNKPSEKCNCKDVWCWVCGSNYKSWRDAKCRSPGTHRGHVVRNWRILLAVRGVTWYPRDRAS